MVMDYMFLGFLATYAFDKTICGCYKSGLKPKQAIKLALEPISRLFNRKGLEDKLNIKK